MTRTLLLTQSYQPLGSISWKRAINLFFLGKVEIIEEYTDKEIKTVSLCIKMPAVVRLISKIKKTNNAEVRFSRANLYTRDGFKCQYCGIEPGTENLNLDHVIPKSRGGKTEWENLVTSCINCNSIKKDRTPAEADMKLLKQPYKPKWLPMFSIKPNKKLPDEWIDYLYWISEIKQ